MCNENKQKDVIRIKINKEESEFRIKERKNRIYISILLNILTCFMIALSYFTNEKKFTALSLIAINLLIFSFCVNIVNYRNIKTLKKIVDLETIYIESDDISSFVRNVDPTLVIYYVENNRKNKQKYDEDEEITEADVNKFVNMYALHKPDQNISDVTPDELLDFASTHGFTINFTESKRNELIKKLLSVKTL